MLKIFVLSYCVLIGNECNIQTIEFQTKDDCKNYEKVAREMVAEGDQFVPVKSCEEEDGPEQLTQD